MAGNMADGAVLAVYRLTNSTFPNHARQENVGYQ